MKKIILNIAGILILLFSLSFLNTAKAQQNTIREIQVSNADGFSKLRSLMMQNFDFTNPNFTEGIVNTKVEFNVAEDGKITNVRAKGDCKYVSEELEHLMSELIYKVDTSKLKADPETSTFVMPVRIMIASR